MESRVILPRYLARWTDGVERVIHAPTLGQAAGLARSLIVPPGVRLDTVEPLERT